jgi:ABC-type thiamin/hydroxymethylpyrimidine transport system permease subunit
MPSGLVALMIGGICRGKGSFLGCHYLMEGLISLVPAYEILHIVNGFLSGGAYLLAAS